MNELSDADLAWRILHHKAEHDRLVSDDPKAAREHWAEYWRLTGEQMARKQQRVAAGPER